MRYFLAVGASTVWHFLHSGTVLGGFQDLPLTRDALVLETAHDDLRDGLEVLGRQCQDGGTGAGQADAEQTVVGFRGDRRQDGGEGGNECRAVGLVDLVLHGRVDQVGVRG